MLCTRTAKKKRKKHSRDRLFSSRPAMAGAKQDTFGRNGVQMVPKRSQMEPKVAQKVPKWCQNDVRWNQMVPKGSRKVHKWDINNYLFGRAKTGEGGSGPAHSSRARFEPRPPPVLGYVNTHNSANYMPPFYLIGSLLAIWCIYPQQNKNKVAPRGPKVHHWKYQTSGCTCHGGHLICVLTTGSNKPIGLQLMH